MGKVISVMYFPRPIGELIFTKLKDVFEKKKKKNCQILQNFILGGKSSILMEWEVETPAEEGVIGIHPLYVKPHIYSLYFLDCTFKKKCCHLKN